MSRIQASLQAQIQRGVRQLRAYPAYNYSLDLSDEPIEPIEPILPDEPIVIQPIQPEEPEEPEQPDEPDLPMPGPSPDEICRACEYEFQALDPGASILPGIGLPSQANGVCTITHKMPNMPPLRINGLSSQSPLANNALFSTEIADNSHTLNLYEVMIPDTPAAEPGQPSLGEMYTTNLWNEGLNVAGTHFHWWGTEPNVVAIHHQNVDMNPIEFAQRTVNALHDILPPSY